ncbi:hypothetical protein FACS1894218_5080 [Bacilli bacterium]|nr:hypothetical protein FACS1894218_5080 [Bacilli bacterium]
MTGSLAVGQHGTFDVIFSSEACEINKEYTCTVETRVNPTGDTISGQKEYKSPGQFTETYALNPTPENSKPVTDGV